MKRASDKVSMISVNKNIRNLHHIYCTGRYLITVALNYGFYLITVNLFKIKGDIFIFRAKYFMRPVTEISGSRKPPWRGIERLAFLVQCGMRYHVAT